MSEWTKAATRSQLNPGELVGIDISGRKIAVYNLGGEFYATDNVCTHAFALMSDGFLEGDTIECPLHGGRFNVKTGKGLGPPITCDLKAYPVRVTGDDVEVDLSSAV